MKKQLIFTAGAGSALTPCAQGVRWDCAPEGGRIWCATPHAYRACESIALTLTTHDVMQNSMIVEFYRKGEDTPALTCNMSAIPLLRVTLCAELAWLDNQSIFRPRTPGKLKTVVLGSALAPADVDRVAVSLMPFLRPMRVTLHDCRVTDEPLDLTLTEPRVLVDELGQMCERDWPGKCAGEQAMVDALRAEYAALPDRLVHAPEYGYSRHGGDAGLRFEATGFFRVEKRERWYMVDPDGYAFFSVGLDCIGSNTAGPVEGIEALHAWLPTPDWPGYAAYNSVPAGRREGVDFARANWVRAFGEDWFARFARLTEYRMKQWGLNTIANWTPKPIIDAIDMPYVWPLDDYPTATRNVFRDFPDVFDPAFERNCEIYGEYLRPFVGDARMIGYFMRNEPNWGFTQGRLCLARELFRTREKLYSRDALIDWLRAKYGDIGALCGAWSMSVADFEAIEQLDYDQFSDASLPDLDAFSYIMADRYVRLPAQALRRVDPQHLNLGMRYAWVASDLMLAGSDCMDVFSINCYRMEPTAEEIADLAARTGKPLMIGEFHFGAPDVGCTGAALRTVRTQRERGVAYRYYVENAAAIPALLGVHYFTLGDETSLGRYDGEGWQIGFTDVCHTPYHEMLEDVMRAHRNLYAVMRGQMPPTRQKADEVPRIAT